MSKPFLSDIAKVLQNEKTKGDKSIYGVIKEKLMDGNKVIGYKVSIGGETDVVEARKMVGAEVGDTVLCTLLANGSIVVSSRKDGDKDAEEAKETADNVAGDLASNYSTTEEVKVMIGELGGGSYQIVEYARSRSDTTAPTSDWSKTIPELTSTYKYLWVRIVQIDSDGTKTVVQAPQLSTALSGIYVFISNIRHDATTIDGGSIYTNNLVVNDGAKIGNFLISGGSLTGSGTTISPDGISNEGTYGEVDIGNGLIVATRIGVELIDLGDDIQILDESGGSSIAIKNGTRTYAGINCGSIGSDADISAAGTVYGNYFRKTGLGPTGNTYTATWYKDNNEYALRYTGSSRKWKKFIKSLSEDFNNPERLYSLSARQFKWKKEVSEDERLNVGFIADEVEAAYPCAVNYDTDENGELFPCDWDVRAIVPAMLELIKHQKKEIDDLTKRIEALEVK